MTTPQELRMVGWFLLIHGKVSQTMTLASLVAGMFVFALSIYIDSQDR